MQFRRVGNHPFFTPSHPRLSLSLCPTVGGRLFRIEPSLFACSPCTHTHTDTYMYTHVPTNTQTHSHTRLIPSFFRLCPRRYAPAEPTVMLLPRSLQSRVLCLFLLSPLCLPFPSLLFSSLRRPVLFLLSRWKRAYARARAKVCQKPFCSDRKNGTHCLLTCESALMAKVCEIIVNRDYIRENNAAQVLRSPLSPLSLRVHVHQHRCHTHVGDSPSPSCPISIVPVSLSLFLSRLANVSLRRQNTRTHGQRRRPPPARETTAARVNVHTGVCIHTRETGPGVHAHAWKKKLACARASERASERFAELPYRERGRRYFFYVQRERVHGERHAFDWPG